MSESHGAHDTHAGDMKAGMLGLIIGAICIFIILLSIVKITHHHYMTEKPAATQSAG
jgi:tellurite resistance protein TehA-like permease